MLDRQAKASWLPLTSAWSLMYLCLCLSQEDPLTLPKPGKFKSYFTASTVLKGVTAPIVSSEDYVYEADCGAAASCKILNIPKGTRRLRSNIPSMLVEFQDDKGNVYHSQNVPQLQFLSKELTVVPVTGQSACWNSPAAGAHTLQLPPLSITPIKAGLKFASSHKAVQCTIEVKVSGLPGRQGGRCTVTTTFSISVLPGSFLHVGFAVIHKMSDHLVSHASCYALHAIASMQPFPSFEPACSMPCEPIQVML